MGNIGVKIDVSDAIKGLTHVEEEMPEVVDDSAKETARKGVSNARSQLTRQGSVATETGINSLSKQQINSSDQKVTYGVEGRSYLKLVDTGTDAHTPDINYRLIAWATQHGFEVSEIVQHIEEEGTKPHPENASWRSIAWSPLEQTLPQKIANKARRRIL